MKHGFYVCASVLALAIGSGRAPEVWATETQKYSYDPLGRLVSVKIEGTVNNGAAQSVCYDTAGNRTTYKSDAAGALAACATTPSPTPTPTPTPGNSPPVAVANSIAVMCNSVNTVNVTANDTDPEGNYPLTVTNVTITSGNAQVYVASASSIEVWGAPLPGPSTATYTVKDSLNASSTGNLTIQTNGKIGVCDIE